MKTRELVKLLASNGYTFARSSKHVIYSNGTCSVAVPHDKNISIGTLRDIFTTVYGDRVKANEQMRLFRNKGF